MPDPIDTMAKTINSADPTFLPGHFHDRAVASLIVRALDAAGFTIVPKAPTREQLDVTNHSDEHAAEIYSAMVTAGAVKL